MFRRPVNGKGYFKFSLTILRVARPNDLLASREFIDLISKEFGILIHHGMTATVYLDEPGARNCPAEDRTIAWIKDLVV